MTEFEHHQAGHCESGVTSALLGYHGLSLSEPMALGLSSALVFAHFPFLRVGGIPVTAYRMPPGAVYHGLRRRLGVRMHTRRYRDAASASTALNAHLDNGGIAGLQSSVYWLPYFPPEMRFHFNAHNLIVYGREGDEYLVSDPVFETAQRCPRADLEVARFAKGKFAPRGLMYYPAQWPRQIDYAQVGQRAIRRTCHIMLHAPVPWVGVRGIRRLANTVGKLDDQATREGRRLVSSVIRMQEEIGTGGGGFRFMYAAFLQELAQYLDDDLLREAEAKMTEAGDAWRLFALDGAYYCRGKGGMAPRQLQQRLLACAEQEQAAFRLLFRFKRKQPRKRPAGEGLVSKRP